MPLSRGPQGLGGKGSDGALRRGIASQRGRWAEGFPRVVRRPPRMHLRVSAPGVAVPGQHRLGHCVCKRFRPCGQPAPPPPALTASHQAKARALWSPAPESAFPPPTPPLPAPVLALRPQLPARPQGSCHEGLRLAAVSEVGINGGLMGNCLI